jgi:hypothetical protein
MNSRMSISPKIRDHRVVHGPILRPCTVSKAHVTEEELTVMRGGQGRDGGSIK